MLIPTSKIVLRVECGVLKELPIWLPKTQDDGKFNSRWLAVIYKDCRHSTGIRKHFARKHSDGGYYLELDKQFVKENTSEISVGDAVEFCARIARKEKASRFAVKKTITVADQYLRWYGVVTDKQPNYLMLYQYPTPRSAIEAACQFRDGKKP